jgi:hypothetical protein
MNTPLRNEKGQLMKGHTANPNGRPKGFSLNDLLIEALEKDHRTYKVDPKTKKKKLVKTKYAVLVVQRLLDKAIKDGDIKALKEIFDRIEGKATQPVTGPNGGPLEHMVITPEAQKAMMGMQDRFLKVKAEADAKRAGKKATNDIPSGNHVATKKKPVKKVVKRVVKRKVKK